MPAARLGACDLDQDACYRAVKGRDRRFDGVFYTAVRTTGIYCRPSCPAITPAARQRVVLPHRGRRAGRRLPRLPPLPARRDPGVAGVGRRRRRRRPGDAAGLRRRRRARGRRGPGQRAGLLDPPAQPRGHPGVRRRPARARPLASRADRPGADRDHRPDLRRRRVRGRVRQRAAVQRHRPRGVRRHARPSCASGSRQSRRTRDRPAPSAPASPCASRSPPTTCTTSSRSTRCAGSRRPGRAGTSARCGCPHGPGVVRRRARRPHARPRRRAPSPWPTPATSRPPSSAPAGCSTPTATRSRSTRRSPRTPCSPRWCADVPGLRVPGQLDGAEVAVQTVLGQQVSLAAARTAAARLVDDVRRAARPRGIARGDPALPDDGDPRGARPRDAADAARPGRALVGLAAPSPSGDVGSTAAPTAPRPAPRCWPCPASGPGPPTTSRCGRSATPTCSCRPTSACATPPTRLGLDDATDRSETLATLALLRADAAVVGGARRHEPTRRGLDPPTTNGDIR